MSLLKASLTAALLCSICCVGGAVAKHSTTAAQTQTTVTTHHHVHNGTHGTVVTTTRTHSIHAIHSVGSSRHHSHEPVLQETKTIAVVTRDRHGRVHKVFKHVTVPVEVVSTSHKESRRVAVMLRDRHGHLHKVYKTEVVEVADVHRGQEHQNSGRTHTVHTAQSGEAASEEAAGKSKKISHDDGEPKPDGVEPERLNPSFGKAYALYDEGSNARISGNYSLAIANLGRALAMVPTNSRGGPSVLQLNMEYELAQAAEAQGDLPLAARYYGRAVSDRPNFTEAAVRLAAVLAKSGNYGDALRAARSAVQRSPNDPRTHAVLTIILEKAGSPEEAKLEKQKTKSLMANIHSIDTAPLVSPDVVAPATPPSQEGIEMPPASKGGGDMSDDMESTSELKSETKSNVSPRESKSKAPSSENKE